MSKPAFARGDGKMIFLPADPSQLVAVSGEKALSQLAVPSSVWIVWSPPAEEHQVFFETWIFTALIDKEKPE